MFCKWCGTHNRPSAKYCRVCGEKLPPLDDCGGFSDLVPENLRKKRVKPPENQPELQPELEDESKEPEPSDLE